MCWISAANQSAIFRFLTAHMTINQIPYVILPTTNQFSLIFAPPFIVTEHNEPSMYNFSDF